MRTYLLLWAGLTALCLLACWLLPTLGAADLAHPARYLTVGFMALLTLGVHLVGARGIARGGEESIAWLMGTFGLQMLGSIVFVAIGLMKTWPGDVLFAGTFLLFFAVYLVFEIRALLANLRPQNRGQKPLN